MADTDTRVVANYQTAEYGKFIQLTNTTEFPAVSVTRLNSPNVAGRAPLSSVEIYPKFAVITYDARLGINNALPFGDNSSIDAFGRLRVSEPKSLFDSKLLTDKQPQVFDEIVNGNATSTFVPNDSLVLMSTTTSGDYVVRQTPIHFNYQPGKSMVAIFTGVFTPETNITKRIGMFQGLTAAPYEPSDGIFLEAANGAVSFRVLKTQGTYTSLSASQSQWNLDKLDGTGGSGLTIDFTKAQIVYIDYEWLGVGRVRCGFAVQGRIIYVHEFTNFNLLSAPYMTSGSQPARYEIRQTGAGSGSLKQICCSVMTEGGEDNVGTAFTVATSGSTSVDTTLRPLLGIRLTPGIHDLSPILKTVEILNLGNTAIRYSVYRDPTITGGSLTYTASPSFSQFQYAEGSPTLSLSGGYEVYSAYAPQGNSTNSSGTGQFEIAGELSRLGTKINGTPVQFVIAARAVTGTAASVYAAANMLSRG